ncbi:hypothetical protein KW782_04435 [Candidatus Parcubacteria bacterium]|nr:hypothetical protein [Candidatus Parcubacteria bacterium]
MDKPHSTRQKRIVLTGQLLGSSAESTANPSDFEQTMEKITRDQEACRRKCQSLPPELHFPEFTPGTVAEML